MRGAVTGGVRRAAVVVGREAELGRLLQGVHDARAGGAGCVFVVGEGGVGKTRLLTEVADLGRHLGLAVLAGRAPVSTPVAFSVPAEALRSWLRAHAEPPLPPFDAGLRLVIPEWHAETGPAPALSASQLRLLALEGVARLVATIASSRRGAVVILDDLHAADPDSLEAVRYLAAAASAGVLVVGALRSREGTLAEQVVRALNRDLVAEVVELEPLGRREVTDLLGSLLDAEPPEQLVSDVVARTDGVPLLVEEVLDAHLRAGSVELGERGARWRGGDTVVSRTLCDMVESRLERLSDQQRQVVTAGAVLGGFEPSLLAAVAQQAAVVVGEAVSGGVDAGLLESVGGAVAFRHAVIREAVLEVTLPHVLGSIHARAAAALAVAPVTVVPGAAATGLERRAHHLTQIDEHDEAAELLTTAARIRLDEHALLGAEALARTALDLAQAAAVRDGASDALARVLSAQGRWIEALALDEAAARRDKGTPARRRRMAACALEAARPELAAELIAGALEAGDDSPLVHVMAGRLALTAGDAASALAAARRALAVSEAAAEAESVCAALDLQGRALDFAGRRSEAVLAWARQAEVAESAGLTHVTLRALVQLGKIELFDGRPPERLAKARDLAAAAGALVEQALAEECLAIALILQGDPAAGRDVAVEAAERCRALRLDLLPYLLVTRAGAMSLLGEDGAEAFLSEAEALAPTADMTLHTSGIRADIALRAGRYAEAVDWLRTAVDTWRSLPGAMPTDSPCQLVWALAATGRTADAAAALADARTMPDLARWYGRPVLLAAAEAMLAGDEAGVDVAITSATGRMPFDVALMRVLSAEIIRGPARVRWLREALDIYEAAGAEAHTGRVRRLLREAGGPVPRRRRAGAGVRPELAQRGVTSREAEVLRLLGEGLSNTVIAERLYLSVRTVETHVSSLLAKLGVESRGQLTALSAAMTHGEGRAGP